MEGVTVDQVDAVVEESFLKKKVAANFQKLYFLFKCLLYYC